METIQSITHDIRVSVEVAYHGFSISDLAGKYLFAYKITIENLSHNAVQLIDRHWIICDAYGMKRNVDGPGVVGQQPVIKPGQVFIYDSGCPLETEIGYMEGSYTMINLTHGLAMEIKIPRFNLIAPQLLN